MGGSRSGRTGRLTVYLLALNLLVLLAGLGMEYVLANRYPDLPEFNAAKIRIWSQPDAYRPGSGSPPARVAQPGIERVCLEVTDLSHSLFLEMRALTRDLGIADEKCGYAFSNKLAWWVFWPPEYEASQRDKALRAMRAAGQRDIFPINQGAMAQAFSLGVFSSEAQARQLRDALRRKGLDKVDHGPRPGMGTSRLSCELGHADQTEQLLASLPVAVRKVAAERCGADNG